MWIPNNPVSLAAGLQDSFEEALTYMETVIGDVGPASSRERKVAYLQNGPEVVRFLQGEGVQFVAAMEYPDYYPDKPAARSAGASSTPSSTCASSGSLGKSIRMAAELPMPFHRRGAPPAKAFTMPKHFFKTVGILSRAAKRLTGQQLVGLGDAWWPS